MRAPAGMPARRDEPSCRAPPDRIRRGTEVSRGASRNRRTTRATWSSPISTRASAFPASGSSAASATMPWSRPTRRRWRRWIAPARGGAKLRASCRSGRTGRYGLYEALDYTPARLPEGEDGRDRACLHGAPSGHDRGRARQRASSRHDARALPRRTDRPGHRAPAPGTSAARCGRGPFPTRVGEDRRRSRTRPADAPSLLLAAPAHSAHPAALQRPVRR